MGGLTSIVKKLASSRATRAVGRAVTRAPERSEDRGDPPLERAELGGERVDLPSAESHRVIVPTPREERVEPRPKPSEARSSSPLEALQNFRDRAVEALAQVERDVREKQDRVVEALGDQADSLSKSLDGFAAELKKQKKRASKRSESGGRSAPSSIASPQSSPGKTGALGAAAVSIIKKIIGKGGLALLGREVGEVGGPLGMLAGAGLGAAAGYVLDSLFSEQGEEARKKVEVGAAPNPLSDAAALWSTLTGSSKEERASSKEELFGSAKTKAKKITFKAKKIVLDGDVRGQFTLPEPALPPRGPAPVAVKTKRVVEKSGRGDRLSDIPTAPSEKSDGPSESSTTPAGVGGGESSPPASSPASASPMKPVENSPAPPDDGREDRLDPTDGVDAERFGEARPASQEASGFIDPRRLGAGPIFSPPSLPEEKSAPETKKKPPEPDAVQVSAPPPVKGNSSTPKSGRLDPTDGVDAERWGGPAPIKESPLAEKLKRTIKRPAVDAVTGEPVDQRRFGPPESEPAQSSSPLAPVVVDQRRFGRELSPTASMTSSTPYVAPAPPKPIVEEGRGSRTELADPTDGVDPRRFGDDLSPSAKPSGARWKKPEDSLEPAGLTFSRYLGVDSEDE